MTAAEIHKTNPTNTKQVVDMALAAAKLRPAYAKLFKKIGLGVINNTSGDVSREQEFCANGAFAIKKLLKANPATVNPNA